MDYLNSHRRRPVFSCQNTAFYRDSTLLVDGFARDLRPWKDTNTTISPFDFARFASSSKGL